MFNDTTKQSKAEEVKKTHGYSRKATKQKVRRSRQKWRSPYPTYAFTDHDPILDVIQTALEESGETLGTIAKISHVSMSTIIGYKNKYVKRPQATPAFAVLTACRCTFQVSYNGKKFQPWTLKTR